MTRVTINKINEALRRLAPAETEIVRGNGYFYFAGTEPSGFRSQSVYVNNLNDLTVEEWVREYRYLRGDVNTEMLVGFEPVPAATD